MSRDAHARAPLSDSFKHCAAEKPNAKRPAPVSVRFDAEERARLERDAAGMSLGGYIKSRVFDDDAATRRTRGKAPVKDWEALGRVLGALGRSGIPDALERLMAAQERRFVGRSADVDSALVQACADIAAMRRDLVAALGLKPVQQLVMILHGNQRGGARDLALHLMNDENERVQLHELRGFVADDLQGAFQESYAVSRGTRCKQHLYSLSLSPPKDAACDDVAFMTAVDRAEKRLGLEGQPRAVVFHEKRGRDGELRRHAHAVWCRINTETMTAKQISHDRRKLNDLARELYIEHDWQMPRGFIAKEDRNPRNYSLAEWQQAKRVGKDPDALKRMFQECWALSDGKAAFAHTLKERGYILARGDRRGFVAVDHKGEAYAVSRWVGIKAKQAKARLQSADDLPSVKEGQAQAAKIITDRLKELEAEQRAKLDAEKARIEKERQAVAARARGRETALRAAQAERQRAEQAERDKRIRTGLRGFLDRITGRRKALEAQNQKEAAQALRRDKAERAEIRKEKSRTLSRAEKREAFIKTRTQSTLDELRQDRRTLSRTFEGEADASQAAKRDAFKERRRSKRPKRARTHSRDGPSLERQAPI